MVIGKEMGQLPVADRRQIVGAAITNDIPHLPATRDSVSHSWTRRHHFFVGNSRTEKSCA